ncbi:RluA family pseudouridine synthase [Wenyingzhuangia marina]|uniref:tRNA pseudouridine32 synthase / 23S rRNA pseudouridine746 synthase n=1 Tax=Wenyingzhuangia marina TaxID=1195760 RepID=A0A1M5UMA2_9FLAO|nr:RluA family pseudouridine synthase [Wenyingzhuangia marina]GGF66875.1 RNA pseudouridine synthase [Wenyingzhuangia marina]SHH64081.1 tRNA pseudouridine32 synthase / 23S rRNA pseudouridine746 synthase [Wenyingzhuangia marina]
MSVPHYFHFYNEDVSGIDLPKKFTYPFYYEPHLLSKLAVVQLQEYLNTQTDFIHDFSETGKMFGVLVVKNQQNKIGFLAAVSGKLADSNTHAYFVPPIFDMLPADGFYKIEEEKLNVLTKEIETLQNNVAYIQAIKNLKLTQNNALQEKEDLRMEMIEAKKNRKVKRGELTNQFSDEALKEKLTELDQQSIVYKLKKRNLASFWENEINLRKKELAVFESQIQQLKKTRREQSNILQQYLFNQYQFLNKEGIRKGVIDIFKDTPLKTPPAAAGECAAPKLLQYAFANNLTPICMAEFWWGTAPNSEIRKHGQFYPACQGKCKPILGHMLKGMTLDENPLLENPAIGKELSYLYEDDFMVVVNKPAEFLSVPGKTINDSVYLRIKQKYPNATGPLIVHRLDMSTSGIMLIALDKDTHEKLQSQFIKRQVKKRYLALLDGVVKEDKGTIELPLRLDIDDRPRQLVCYEHGKPAKTLWKVLDRSNNKTRIYFYPVTGRTHQLRVHASHLNGLNTPIIGDDLYGSKADRLYLHAEHISLTHPVTKEKIEFKAKADF